MRIVLVFLVALLSSCSISKKVSRDAQKMVLHDSALQNAHVGISVYDPASGKYLFDHQGDKYFVPASNTKLPTCYAAMKFLGDSLKGIKFREANSEIILQGTGDPTFLWKEFSYQPVYRFLSASNKNPVMDFRNWRDEMLGSGWSWNDYLETYMAHRSALPVYGNLVTIAQDAGKLIISPSHFSKDAVFPDTVKFTGVSATRDPYSNRLRISNARARSVEISFHPDTATILRLLEDTLHRTVTATRTAPAGNWQTIYSQPTDSVLKPMMHRSDNFFAEQLLLMTSDELLGYMNDSRIIDSLLKSSLKDLPQPPRWVDGSGLSRYNLFSPRDFVYILNKMKNDFGMERVKGIMMTGNQGTLAGRYKSDSTYIYAKTGTLSGVVALSGFLYTRSGKQLIFSFLVNNHRGSATPVRDAIERFIHRLRENY